MISYIILGIALVVLVFIFSRFHPAPTQKITDSLYAINCGFVNFYALKTTDGILLFDTGMIPAMARRGLHKLGMSPDSVTHIFLTHTDYDHTGGMAAFSQARRHLSTSEEQMINGKTARRGFMHNKPFSPYHTIDDGETIVVGGVAIQLRLTPGHTPGSASYLIDNRIFVTGDLLRLSKGGSILPFLRLMNMRHRQDIQSVKEIQPIAENVEYILTGHTGIYHRKS